MAGAKRHQSPGRGHDRLGLIRLALILFAAVLVLRLFTLQVLEHAFYAALAQDQHQLSQQLLPTRGDILVKDQQSATGTYPLATNQTLHLLFAVPKQVTKPADEAHQLAGLLTIPEDQIAQRLSKGKDLYEPLQHGLTDAQMQTITDLHLPGLFFSDEPTRYYPEKDIGAQLLGFVGFQGNQKVGQYGVEGYYEKQLTGLKGFIKAQKDPSGQLIATAAQLWQPAVNGSDVVLTIDRTIEFEACTKLNEAVQKHGADSGSLVIIDPKTGAVAAMCSSPDFNPSAYNAVTDPSVFNNQATGSPYEPGSVFKGITMAAALNEGKVTPETTYTDTGEVKVGNFTIKNSDLKAHGVRTMNQVLEESLNTGAIFAMRTIGPDTFAKYVKAFGFGQPTGLDLNEKPGNISGPASGKEIYAVTGAFGQGLTVTPLQLAMAYGALANGGKLMRPYVVDYLAKPDGTKTVTAPQTIRQVISPETSATISAMLVRVVQNGHGKRAGVPGYFVAGKTGTAQIPDPTTGGYLPNLTIGTFAGFAPVEDPKFVMVVQLVKPRDVQFAESSAAPLFGEMAKFLLPYLDVPPSPSAATP
ncbi:MAG: penicillin-binding protein 2 [Candidatus Kerfeldbacteria bacterium]|nr:penicillin-binding protein 2 [Candidatus Kerfeldbacteria bacterium]